MAVASTMKVYGIQETLADLNKFDKTMRRQVTKDIQSGAGRLIVSSARSMVPTTYPLTGMRRGSIIKGRSETAYDIKKVQAGIKTIVGRRGTRERTATVNKPLIVDGVRVNNAYTETINFKARPYSLLVAQQKDAAAAIWDHAGIKNRSQFVTNLITEGKGQNRQASRSLTPGVVAVLPAVEKELEKILDSVNAVMNRALRIEHR